jgi:hypothetical protein
MLTQRKTERAEYDGVRHGQLAVHQPDELFLCNSRREAGTRRLGAAKWLQSWNLLAAGGHQLGVSP